MRLSEMGGKEIIEFQKGERLGVLGQTDLLIDVETGKVEAFLIPTAKWLPFGKKEPEVKIGWQHIKKIGPDMIIIDMESPFS